MLRVAGVLAATLVAATVVADVTGAQACGCGLQSAGPVVAHGKSPAGIPWQIRASRIDSRTVDIHFDLKTPGYEDAGYFTSLELPLSDRFIFTADTGSNISPYPESDLSGVASGRVHRIHVRMSEGGPLEFRPHLAPRSVRKRFPWLRELRFFDRFFANERDPLVATAYDARGNVLTRVKSNLGLFPSYCTSC